LRSCFENQGAGDVEKSIGFAVAIFLNQNRKCQRFTFLKKIFLDPIPYQAAPIKKHCYKIASSEIMLNQDGTALQL
jgi:hypothetical protein